ncbi:MAG: C13 family peptidase, partial [Muribaculaceae bacterium]|nr:C13 family peptidase [Muribaculaceae bacterium]
MKKFLLFVILYISGFCSVKAQQYDYSRQDALDIVMRKFAKYDYDYYIYDDVENSKWQVLVDAEPMKGWEHLCYHISIPKKGPFPPNSYILREFLNPAVSMPPSADYEPGYIRNRYGSASTVKPLVHKTSSTNTDNIAASHTYALIISGGGYCYSNYLRYWNDCSFIYQTLVNTYGIPKNHIYPIMSDGDDPGDDQITPDGYKSQSLDLDFDGVNEQILAANRSNISQTLLQLSTELREDDHLFIYVIDHGGITADNQSYIVLWHGARLFDYELANMLSPFLENNVNVNVVLGQCHSGGFITELTKVGCVVATASAEDESSYSCGDIPFDEFVYHWTSAINGANHNQTKVNADTNGDGIITMEEAFLYAKNNDRRDEHPQYNSTPLSIGEDLAFNRVVKAVDLYMQDNEADTGKEPNITTDIFWDSPAVCIRNEDDNVYKHENPYYSFDHRLCHIYVKVRNRGKKDYDGIGKYLHIYWAEASTGIRPASWKGRETNSEGRVTGGHLEPIFIPAIRSGEERLIKHTWALPQLMSVTPGSQFHYCLCAKIMDLPYDDGY